MNVLFYLGIYWKTWEELIFVNRYHITVTCIIYRYYLNIPLLIPCRLRTLFSSSTFQYSSFFVATLSQHHHFPSVKQTKQLHEIWRRTYIFVVDCMRQFSSDSQVHVDLGLKMKKIFPWRPWAYLADSEKTFQLEFLCVVWTEFKYSAFFLNGESVAFKGINKNNPSKWEGRRRIWVQVTA